MDPKCVYYNAQQGRYPRSVVNLKCFVSLAIYILYTLITCALGPYVTLDFYLTYQTD